VYKIHDIIMKKSWPYSTI